jgi:triacylglycerol lipase
VRSLHRRTGRRVALIGHSRGGHLVRAIATRMPGRVSHAISLGADLQAMFGISAPTQLAVAGARRIARVTGHAASAQCLTAECGCAFTRDYLREFPSERVRLTSVYSTRDGVVRWRGVASSPTPIAFKCPELTSALSPTARPTVQSRALAEPELEPD